MPRSKKKVVYPVIFMLVITSIFTSALAILNDITKDQIAFNENLKFKRSILYVFDMLPSNSSDKEINEVFEEFIKSKKINGTEVFVAEKNNNRIGYAFPIEGDGLWGVIEGYAAVSSDYNTLLGIDFIKQSETPGLGGRITEKPFLEQFRGIELEESNSENLVYKPKPGGNVDSISGATSTSKAVKNILNEDIHNFLNNVGGGE